MVKIEAPRANLGTSRDLLSQHSGRGTLVQGFKFNSSYFLPVIAFSDCQFGTKQTSRSSEGPGTFCSE